MDEMWVAIGAYPGFLSGMVFSVITGFSKGRRRFDDLQFGWVAVRGAGSGMLVGAVPFLALLPSESASSQGGISGVLVMASITLLGAISAAGSLAVAKWRRGKARSASVPT